MWWAHANAKGSRRVDVSAAKVVRRRRRERGLVHARSGRVWWGVGGGVWGVANARSREGGRASSAEGENPRTVAARQRSERRAAGCCERTRECMRAGSVSADVEASMEEQQHDMSGGVEVDENDVDNVETTISSTCSRPRAPCSTRARAWRHPPPSMGGRCTAPCSMRPRPPPA